MNLTGPMALFGQVPPPSFPPIPPQNPVLFSGIGDFVLYEVPEPGSGALLCGALAALAVARAMRR